MAVIGLLVIAFVVISPLLTYYVTSTLFFRRSKSTASSKEAPSIPYFIPGIFHAAVLARTGAPKYFAELIKDYGAFAPFKVRAGPRSYIILRDPTHISRVLNAPEHLTVTASKIEIFDRLFGSPKAEGHKTPRSQKEGNSNMPEQTLSSILDANLAATTEAYISLLSANMHDKMFQYDTWTRIEDLWSFLQLVLFRCTLDTLFGSKLLKQCPRMVRDYRDFDAIVEGFIPGMPRLMFSSALKSRDRLHQHLENWLITNHEAELDSEESAAGSSSFNEMTGMKFMRKYYRGCIVGKDEQLNLKARAAEVLSIIHTINTGLVSSTFWTTVETLRKSHLTRKMTDSVVNHFSPITHKYDILGLAQEPLVKSIQVEVQRLRVASCAVRTNETDGFPLDKHWSLRKGARVAMFSHDIALNTNVWKTFQPKAVHRPLEEFWAERFLVPEGTKKSAKSEATADNPDTEDLESLITKLTSTNMYPGSHFVSTLQMATIAVLFAEFDIQLCDTDFVDAVLPLAGEFAYGTVKPLEKIAVRLRKRRT
ncbi:hypothetical protein SVAN01_01152 [Stagonosporopsis vannaccii]|nr:hypothetical protein SVAN01_01152 [Stagonosporopsis vannaccii]